MDILALTWALSSESLVPNPRPFGVTGVNHMFSNTSDTNFLIPSSSCTRLIMRTQISVFLENSGCSIQMSLLKDGWYNVNWAEDESKKRDEGREEGGKNGMKT